MVESTVNKKNIYFSFIFLGVICLGFMFAEIINNRFWLSDFEVYYKAAQRISHGENLYQHSEDGHYIFKYSPTSALLFIPFTIFSFSIAKYIYWCLLTALIITGFYLCIKNINPGLFTLQNKKPVNKVVLLATLILAVHFLRELHLGQVNYLLLFIYIFALHSLNKGKWKLFSVLLGMSIFIKPFAMIFIPYLLIQKKYRALMLFIFSILVFAILPKLFYSSMEITINQYQLWFQELQIELSHKQGLLADANHTVFSVVARYTPIRFILTNNIISGIYQLCLLAFIAFFVFYFVKILPRHNTKREEKQLITADFSLLIALVPLLAFTSENAFIYVQILIFVILLHFQNLLPYEKVLSIIGFLFMGGNFAELIGKKLSTFADNSSLISIGTIILIYLIFMLRKRDQLGTIPSEYSAAHNELTSGN